MHYVEVRFPELLLDDGLSFSEAIYEGLEEMPSGTLTYHEWLGGGRTSGGDGTDLYLEIGGDLKCILDVLIHTLSTEGAPPDTVLYVVTDDTGVTHLEGVTHRLGDLARG
jgi:hypothetical protein